MNTLNKLFVLAALLFAIAAPSFASTTITDCSSSTYVIPSAGTYVLSGPLTASGHPCITANNVSGTTSTPIELDCNGYSITTSGGGANYPFRVTSSSAPVWWHNCTFYSDFSAVDMNQAGTCSGGWVYGYYNTYHDTSESVGYSQVFTSVHENIYATSASTPMTSAPHLVVSFTDYVDIDTDTVDVSLSTNTNQGALILVSDSSHVVIKYSQALASPQTSNVDDPILVGCSGGPSAPCTDIQIYGNYTEYGWDCGLELAGAFDALYIHDNWFYQPGVGVCGYYGISMNNSSIADNRVTPFSSGGGYTTRLIYLQGPEGGASSYFTSNTISGNGLDAGGSPYPSLFGYPFSPGPTIPYWATISGNVISGNHFGSGAEVDFQQNSGFSGGASDNYCGSTVPSSGPFTCH